MAHESELITLRSSNEEDFDSLLTSMPHNTTGPINWRTEAQRGNFMPAVLLLEDDLIRVNDIVIYQTGERLLHLAINYGFYNVIRALIETFKANVNCLNGFGQSPLHLICNNPEQNIYILSYLLKVDDNNIFIRDNAGLTPVCYSIINNFNFAFLSLTYLDLNLEQEDQSQNSLLYFAIVNNNKFAVKLILNNSPQSSPIDNIINKKYYNNTSSLSDILITNKNISITKYLMKYYHHLITPESIASCKKNKLSFPFYNEFNYEMINTVYFYLCGHYLVFIKALMFNGNNSYITSNYILDTVSESNGRVCYRFKIYMLYFMVYHLVLANITAYLKVIGFFMFLINLLIITVLIGEVDKITMIAFGVILVSYSVLLMSNSQDIIPKQDCRSLSKEIYDICVGNIFELPSIDNICEICSIKKEHNDNHCNVCNYCIRDFYFHSNLFNFCINRRNVRWYILFLSSLVLLLFNIVYEGEYHILCQSIIFFAKILKIFQTATFLKLTIEIIAFILGVIYTGKIIVLIICIGMNVTYYNMFRYHKRELGPINERSNFYFKVPDVNFVSFWRFIKNLIS